MAKLGEPELKQEAPLSPRDPCDALYQLKCPSTVTQTDRLSAWGALSATATFYSVTCMVFTFVHGCCTRRNYHTASMQCRACHQQTFVYPILLMSTGP